MNIEKAKNNIDSQLEKAMYAKAPVDNLHPIRVIQSLKSIIGLNIDSPSEKLINWGSLYLKEVDSLPKDYFRYSIKKPKETIVLSEIGKYILLNDNENCIRELQDLCSVSDGNQIFEYLIEFSSTHNKSALSLIWSAYRVNIFMKNKFSYQLLLLSVKSLMNNCYVENGIISKIDNLSVVESIRMTKLTRSNRINANLSGLQLDQSLLGPSSDFHCEIDVRSRGRYAILDYLNNLELNAITKELLLFLDACRMVLIGTDKNSHKEIIKIMDIVIEGHLYVEKNW